MHIAETENANLDLNFRIKIMLASLGSIENFGKKKPQVTSKFSKTVPYET